LSRSTRIDVVDDEMPSPKQPLREWRITLIPKKARYLGRVEAPDAATAIEHAMAEFDLDEAHRSRLVAQPVGVVLTVRSLK
jgi:hypothetical protein